MSCRIGSFNVHSLSDNRSNTRHNAITLIAGLVVEHGLDIVAFQELLTQGALNEIIKELNRLGRGHWDGIHASQPLAILTGAHLQTRSREYGFVWRKDRITLVCDPYIYAEIQKRVDHIWQNCIQAQFNSIKDATDLNIDSLDLDSNIEPAKTFSFEAIQRRLIESIKSELFRPPMVACFRPTGFFGFFNWELRIINTHIIFSGGLKKPIPQRIHEFKQLAGKMHTALNTLRFGNFRSVYTIIAGDYNLSCDQVELSGISDSEFVTDCEHHVINTVQRKATTLRRCDENIQAPDFYSNSYDHFSYDFNRLSDIVKVCDRHNLEKVEAFKTHRTEISDHVPIYIELNI